MNTAANNSTTVVTILTALRTAAKWLRRPPLHLIPLIASGVVIITVFVFWYQLDIGGSLRRHVVTVIDGDRVLIAELRARILWAISAVALVTAVIWNVALSIVIIARHSRNRSLGRWGLIAALGILALIVFVREWQLGGGSSNLIHEAITSRTTLQIRRVTAILDPAAALCVGLVISAACVLSSSVRGTKEIETGWLAARLHDTRLSLYSACLLLAAGVAEIYLLFSWPMSFTEGGDQILIRQLAATVALAAGCVFTLLLLVIFVPVSLVQSGWIAQAVDLANRPEGWNHEAWLKQSGLDVSPIALIGRGAAMLVPTIVGLLPKLLTG